MKTEHAISKLCCGRWFGTTLEGVYQDQKTGKKIELSNGVMFTGVAITEDMKAFEYEIHGDIIEFFNVVRQEGRLIRQTDGMTARRDWYFFGIEPSSFLPVEVLPLVNFGFVAAPSFSMKMSFKKQVFTGTEERMNRCSYFTRGAEKLVRCYKQQADESMVWHSIS